MGFPHLVLHIPQVTEIELTKSRCDTVGGCHHFSAPDVHEWWLLQDVLQSGWQYDGQ